MKHTLTWMQSPQDSVKIGYRAVISSTLDSKEIDTIPPAKRVY